MGTSGFLYYISQTIYPVVQPQIVSHVSKTCTLETKCIFQYTTSHNVLEQLKFSDRDQTHCGIRGPGGRAEDSRAVDPGFKSRNWAKFQNCGETLK